MVNPPVITHINTCSQYNYRHQLLKTLQLLLFGLEDAHLIGFVESAVSLILQVHTNQL